MMIPVSQQGQERLGQQASMATKDKVSGAAQCTRPRRQTVHREEGQRPLDPRTWVGEEPLLLHRARWEIQHVQAGQNLCRGRERDPERQWPLNPGTRVPGAQVPPSTSCDHRYAVGAAWVVRGCGVGAAWVRRGCVWAESVRACPTHTHTHTHTYTHTHTHKHIHTHAHTHTHTHKHTHTYTHTHTHTHIHTPASLGPHGCWWGS
jgi:hypothetical protein